MAGAAPLYPHLRLNDVFLTVDVFEITTIIYFSGAEPRTILRGDTSRIRQVLTSLFGKAIKFTNEGHILVDVVRVDQEETTRTARFSVEDSGIGIPHDKIDGLFDKFTRCRCALGAHRGGGLA